MEGEILAEFEHNIIVLNSKPKQQFKAVIDQVNMDLICSETYLNHAQFGQTVKELIHKTLQVGKKLMLSSVVRYLHTLESDSKPRKYALHKYTKKCTVEQLLLLLKYSSDLNVYDYLDNYDEYPQEFQKLIMENLDYDKLASLPFIVIDLEIKYETLRPAVLPIIKQILEISELISVGTKFCLECLKFYKNQDSVVTRVLDNDLDSRLVEMDRMSAISDELVIFYLADGPAKSNENASEPKLIELDKPTIKIADLDINEKQKIISMMQDDDNDEYDDTYDDLLPQQVEDGEVDKIEQILVECYTSSPEIFHKSAKGSKARLKLIQDTGMSDEQLQGWYVMLNRSKAKGKILEKYEWRGNVKGLKVH